MVQIDNGLAVNAPSTSLQTTATQMRRALSALFRRSADAVPIAGVLVGPGGVQTGLGVTTSATALTYSVSSGYALIVRTDNPALGGYIIGSPNGVSVTTPAGDSSNPRWDRIYICQPDPEQSDSGVPRIDVINGIPAGTPSLPSLPAGSLELARALVPAGMSHTSSATVTDERKFTAPTSDWNFLDNKPSTFPPSAHHHPGSDITSGTVAEPYIDAAIARQSALNNEITNRQNAVSGEATSRQNADTSLQNSLNNEVTNRQNGDNSLKAQTTSSGTVVGGWQLNRFALRKVNGVVHADISVNRTGGSISSGSTGNIVNLQIGTVPSGWYPEEQYAPLASGPGGPVCAIYVDNTGKLFLAAMPPNYTVANNSEISAGGCWIVAG